MKDGKLEQSILRSECCQRYQAEVNPNLVITGAEVYLGEEFAVLLLVKDFVDSGQGVRVLDGHFVQCPIVYAHPVRAVFLDDEDDRRSPWGATGLNESYLEELL